MKNFEVIYYNEVKNENETIKIEAAKCDIDPHDNLRFTGTGLTNIIAIFARNSWRKVQEVKE